MIKYNEQDRKELIEKFKELPVLPELKEYFENATNTAFIVGGALRDVININKVRNDIDIMIAPKSMYFPNGLTQDQFKYLMIEIWVNHGDNEVSMFNVEEGKKYGNIFVYKKRNWIIDYENQKIQISYNPKLVGFENYVSESCNCILFNGKDIYYEHNAIQHAKKRIFKVLHDNEVRIKKLSDYGFKREDK